MGTSKVAFLSSFPPRECGIATFTQDLVQAVVAAGTPVVEVVAVEEPEARRGYDRGVLTTLRADDPADHRRVAARLGRAGVDVLSVQHEYGLYGGRDGALLLELLESVRLPVVTTLHTVLQDPDPHLVDVTRAICELSHATVVMATSAIPILEDRYGVDPRDVVHIPHGGPTVVRQRGARRQAKLELGLSGRTLVSTFGLLGPSKGIEYAIRALPGIVGQQPDLCYAVLGRTHPGQLRVEGERYRRTLQALVDELDLGDHVLFVDRYLDQAELLRWLLASDVYLVPYLDPEQIVSGTLSYALSCGKAVIATGFPYARELLADGRGVVVPFRDPDAIGEQLSMLLRDRDRLAATEARAYEFGKRMRWPSVGRAYSGLFARLLTGRSHHARIA